MILSGTHCTWFTEGSVVLVCVDSGPLVTVFGHLKCPVPQCRATPVASGVSGQRDGEEGGRKEGGREGKRGKLRVIRGKHDGGRAKDGGGNNHLVTSRREILQDTLESL